MSSVSALGCDSGYFLFLIEVKNFAYVHFKKNYFVSEINGTKISPIIMTLKVTPIIMVIYSFQLI